MNNSYDASTIEVLTGLDPVRKRPGMYTDTRRPDHLAQEVIDNSVDEAIAGFASVIEVTLHADGSMSVADDGRGMPVDIHPEQKLSGVEVILTKLHAGGKFSHKTYQFSGGLHGVGVSVVNALSSRLEVRVRRRGQEYAMAFAHGEAITPLSFVGSVGQRNTGTTLRFWPDTHYFDTINFSITQLMHLLRAKAVLCPGLKTVFIDETTAKRQSWYYDDGLNAYLKSGLNECTCVPDPPFSGSMSDALQAIDWAAAWVAEGEGGLTESYVNLVPTSQGGTHVSGFRSGLLEALREYCEYRGLLPRGVRLVPDDIWECCVYVLSVKLAEPQFTGQTKERLSSRECAAWVSGLIKDAFSLWLSRHPEFGDGIAEIAIARAQRRLKEAKRVVRKRTAAGPTLPGKLTDCTSQEISRTELFLVEGDSAGGSAKQAREREFQAVMPLRGKVLNTWEVDSADILASREVRDISTAIGVEPGATDLSGLRYGKICILADADSDGAHIATLLCALFVRHFRRLVVDGHVFVAMPPLYRIDAGKEIFYSLDEAEKHSVLERITAENFQGKVEVQRFKGLGEMNPPQLRETTMAPDTRRLVRLTMAPNDDTDQLMDMLLAKKRSSERRMWLEKNGDLADI